MFCNYWIGFSMKHDQPSITARVDNASATFMFEMVLFQNDDNLTTFVNECGKDGTH